VGRPLHDLGLAGMPDTPMTPTDDSITAEQIVRLLAEQWGRPRDLIECPLCGADQGLYDHPWNCPVRMAAAWVGLNPA